MLLLLKLVSEKQKTSITLIKYSFLFSVIYFITSFWFVQRLLFLLPSLLLLAATRKKIKQTLPLLYFGYILYAPIVFVGLFDHTLLRPVFSSVPVIPYSLLPLDLLKQIISSGFIALFLWLIYLAYTDIDQDQEILEKDIVFPLASLALYFTTIFLLLVG